MLTEQQKKTYALIIPLLLALGAAITQSIAIHRAVKTNRFLVLKTELKAGSLLDRAALQSVNLAEKFIPTGAIRSEDLESVVNRRTRRPLEPGKLLFQDDITGRRIEPAGNCRAIPTALNRIWLSAHDVDVGDSIFVTITIPAADGDPPQENEIVDFGPFRVLQVADWESHDKELQVVELEVPNKDSEATMRLSGREQERFNSIRKDDSANASKPGVAPAAKTPAPKAPAAKTPAAKTPAAKTPAAKASDNKASDNKTSDSKTSAAKAPGAKLPATK